MNVDVVPTPEERLQEVLSREALDFIAELHDRFEPRRQELMAARRERAAELARGGTLDFLDELATLEQELGRAFHSGGFGSDECG